MMKASESERESGHEEQKPSDSEREAGHEEHNEAQ
jgi:hypothetical protein